MPRHRLTAKHQVFLREYAKSLNLSVAVMSAYPGMTYSAARAYGVYLKKKHPLVSERIRSIHKNIADAIDPVFLIRQCKTAFEDHYQKKIILTTRRSDGLLVRQEHSTTSIAMSALSALVRILDKHHRS